MGWLWWSKVNYGVEVWRCDNEIMNQTDSLSDDDDVYRLKLS